MSVAKGTAGFKCDDKLFVTMVEELGAADCEDVKVGMRITKWMDEDLAETMTWKSLKLMVKEAPKPWVFTFADVGGRELLSPTAKVQPAATGFAAPAPAAAPRGPGASARDRFLADGFAAGGSLFMSAANAPAAPVEKKWERAADCDISAIVSQVDIDTEKLESVLLRVTDASDAKAEPDDIHAVKGSTIDDTSLSACNQIVLWLADRLCEEETSTKIKTLTLIKNLANEGGPLFQYSIRGLAKPATGSTLMISNLEMASECELEPHPTHGDKPQRLVHKHAIETLGILRNPLDKDEKKKAAMIIKEVTRRERDAEVQRVAAEMEAQQKLEAEEELARFRDNDSKRRAAQSEEEMKQTAQDESRYLYVTKARAESHQVTRVKRKEKAGRKVQTMQVQELFGDSGVNPAKNLPRRGEKRQDVFQTNDGDDEAEDCLFPRPAPVVVVQAIAVTAEDVDELDEPGSPSSAIRATVVEADDDDDDVLGGEPAPAPDEPEPAPAEEEPEPSAVVGERERPTPSAFDVMGRRRKAPAHVSVDEEEAAQNKAADAEAAAKKKAEDDEPKPDWDPRTGKKHTPAKPAVAAAPDPEPERQPNLDDDDDLDAAVAAAPTPTPVSALAMADDDDDDLDAAVAAAATPRAAAGDDDGDDLDAAVAAAPTPVPEPVLAAAEDDDLDAALDDDLDAAVAAEPAVVDDDDDLDAAVAAAPTPTPVSALAADIDDDDLDAAVAAEPEPAPAPAAVDDDDLDAAVAAEPAPAPAAASDDADDDLDAAVAEAEPPAAVAVAENEDDDDLDAAVAAAPTPASDPALAAAEDGTIPMEPEPEDDDLDAALDDDLDAAVAAEPAPAPAGAEDGGDDLDAAVAAEETPSEGVPPEPAPVVAAVEVDDDEEDEAL